MEDKDKEGGLNTETAEAPARAPPASSSSSTNKAAGGEEAAPAPTPPPTEPGQAKDDTSAAAAAPASSSRIIYGKDVPNESDEIQYKWGAIFYNYSPAQRALLALDEISMYSITDTRSANNTSRILQQLVGDRAVITDGCAAAGGNVLSFAQHFRQVQAVELDPQRYSLLEHNVKALGLMDTVSTHHGDFLEKLGELKQDVVFLDPPWGGKSYTENDTVDLTFSGLPLSELCERLKPHARYIALKLPLNFNFEGFKQAITSSVVRADDRCARKQLLVILDTTGKVHPPFQERGGGGEGGRGRGRGGGGGGNKRGRDDKPAPWTIKRKT
jgi:hypothetical protein